MKKLLPIVLIVLLASISIVKAQYVTIPDANFRAYLKQQYPSCFNANDEMDTQCGSIKNETTLTVTSLNISNLTGVEHFTSLTTLYCPSNQLTSLPSLPSTLISLYCQNNQLSSLPTLPSSLTSLYCNNNQLSGLPTLPSLLKYLHCYYNQLVSLPALPGPIVYLYCNNNQLTSLPVLTGSLIWIDCNYNKLTSLPNLPSSLNRLDCTNNQLTSLPNLPGSLAYLYCNNNKLTSLPTLPGSLATLYCHYNQLNSLPNLPSSLYFLYCYKNQLTNLPNLPGSIGRLDCYYNQLTSLPSLPNTLSYLDCRYNYLNCLPLLPSNINTLFVYGGNPISCLPNIPNSTFACDITKTVCDPTNNPYGCALYPVISGNVYLDINKNGIKDTGENGWTNANIKIQPGNYLAETDLNGNYSIAVDTGSYTIKVNNTNLSYYSIVPNTQTAVFTNYGQIDTQNDFALQQTTSANDLQITITVLNNARPGRSVGYIITYRNIGTTTLSGNISFDYDAQLNFDSTSQTLSSHIGNNITWNYSSLNPGQSRNIRIYFTPPQTIALGTKLNFTATINPLAGEATPLDNVATLEHVVTGSYDPNFKEVLPIGNITPAQVASQDPFTYVVHFQNTGTDTAFVVSIKDTISTNFEILDIQAIAASHNYKFTMKNGAAEWQFDNILLVDSITNEPLSHGFVKYRVIPKNTLVVGDEIKNTAHIFFDFNAPVVTNTTLNRVAIPTSINHSEASALLNIYPNPSKGSVTIQYPEAGQGSIKVMSADSRVVYDNSNIDFSSPSVIDLSNEQKGIYIIEVTIGDNIIRKKLVIQ